MNALKIFIFSMAVLLCLQASGQGRDSVSHLQEVIIEQSRLDEYAIGHYTLSVDSNTLKLAGTSNIADMLRFHGYGHVRGYGLGGLTTPSFRGTGSSHTAILWNGINLQGALNGQSDFVQIPLSFIDDVQLQLGGSASLYGSGAIGGTLHLNNKARFGEGLQFKTTHSAGSFNNIFNDMSLVWSGKRFITSTKIFRNRADNNFPFYNTSTRSREKREYAGLWQWGILQQNYWLLAPAHQLNFKLWYQDNTIEVPNATTTPRRPDAQQHDEFYRVVLGYQYEQSGLSLSWQGSLYHHVLDFYDHASLPQINSTSTFNTILNKAEGHYIWNDHWNATAGVTHTWEEGEAVELGSSNPTRNRTAFAGAVKYSDTKWTGVFSARQEWVSAGTAVPFSPGLSAEFYPAAQLKITGSVSRNYRIATFNDLYWVGAGARGNPDLQPETSWSQEAGVAFTSRPASTVSYSFRVNAFTSKVDNWILWASAGQVWSPENVKKVWSRGIESNWRIGFPVGKVHTEFNALYSYTRSTTEESYNSSSTVEIHKQLALTPQHEGNVNAQLQWRRYSVKTIASYTGKQYADDGNDEYFALKGYVIMSAWLTRDFSFNAFRAELTAQINNAFDQSYQSRPGYPMPGRNFKIGATLYFRKPIKS